MKGTALQGWLLLLVTGIASISVAGAEERFTYGRLDFNGVLVSIFKPVYVKDGVEYRIGSVPTAENLCGAFGLVGDVRSPGTRNYNIEELPDQPMLMNWQGREVRESTVALKVIFCGRPREASEISTHHSGRIQNADGTVTILEPRFLYIGTLIPFHSIAGPKGPCMIYGLGDPVRYIVEVEPRNATSPPAFAYFGSPSWRADGTLYHQTNVWEPGTDYTNTRISSVTCQATGPEEVR